jgi:hypothetical protein
VLVFSFDRAILLVGVEAGDKVGTANGAKKRVESLILVTLASLHSYNLTVEHALN